MDTSGSNGIVQMLLRYALYGIGLWVMQKGWVDETGWTIVAGAILSAAPVVQAAIIKYRTRIVPRETAARMDVPVASQVMGGEIK